MLEPIIIDIPTHKDPKGALGVIDFPFWRRVFWVTNSNGVRGRHSHLCCIQLLTPIIGTFMIILSKNGLDKREIVLTGDYPQGVLVPPNWCISYVALSPEPTLILVLADESYDKDVIIPCEREDIHGFDDLEN